MLAVDVFVVRWSDDNNGMRLAVAVAVFALAYFSARFLPGGSKSRDVLSRNMIKGTMDVDAKKISALGADRVLSDNKTSGDMKVKADEISS